MSFFGLSLTMNLKAANANAENWRNNYNHANETLTNVNRDLQRQVAINQKQAQTIEDTNTRLLDAGKAISKVQTAIKAARSAGKVSPTARQALNKAVDDALTDLVTKFPKKVEQAPALFVSGVATADKISAGTATPSKA